MQPLEKVVKVSAKGQITLPRGVRELLHSDTVRTVADQDAIRIEPFRDPISMAFVRPGRN